MSATDDHASAINPVHASALWYTGPLQAEIRPSKMNGTCTDESVRVQALASAISRGTESLVFAGKVPESEWTRMRAPFQAGDFPFPVKYGYALTGRVVQGPLHLMGRIVFTLNPHETLFDIPVNAVIPVPDDIPLMRSILGANMETALNAVWDASPGPGDHISVVGAGVVGALTAFILGKIPGTKVTLIDRNPARRALAANLGVEFSDPEAARGDQDVVFHASGNPAGLMTALNLGGNEAKIIEMSWYGERESTLQLGGAFHSRRLTIISSQVGSIPSYRQPRWTFRRRLQTALTLLSDGRLDALLTNTYPFHDIAQHLPHILKPESDILCPVITY
ncbi:MAG: zinc-binding alcohol dehydrogenase [Stappiaceae bacterium]